MVFKPCGFFTFLNINFIFSFLGHGEEAVLSLDLGVENGAVCGEVVDLYYVAHRIVGLRVHELGIAVFIAVKHILIEAAPFLALIYRSVECSGLNEILEEVAAVAQLRPQAVGVVSKLAHAVKVGYLHKVNGNAEARRGRTPTAGTHEYRALIAQEKIELAYLARDEVLLLLCEREIRLDLDKHAVADRQAHVAAHEVAVYAEEEIANLGHNPGLVDAARLQGTALQQVYAELTVLLEVAGKFNVNGVVVFAAQQRHDLCHGVGKRGAFY